MYNIILILSLIGIIFFMTNNEKLSKKLNKHSIKLIFLLLLVYMIVNKLYHGVIVIIIVFLIYYNKQVVEYVKESGIKLDLNNLINNLQLDKLKNKLQGKMESFANEEESDENEDEKKDDDIFTQIDKLETLANRNGNVKKAPFKDMVSELRKTFDTIYKQVNVD